MKIKSMQFHDAGPLQGRRFGFDDDWRGGMHTEILFSGPNGCGKSTLLRAVAMLWDAAGHWLDMRAPLPTGRMERGWLQRWGGVALVLVETGLTGAGDPPLGLIFGDEKWCAERMAEGGDTLWVGETVARTGKPGNPKRAAIIHNGEPWFENWAEERKKMIVGFAPSPLPNVVFMDAEERRWVPPRRRIGEFLPQQPALRWLPRYIASDDWESQLEASLINLKLTEPERFSTVLDMLNGFLPGKTIEANIRPGESRLRVSVVYSGASHTLDDLSAGEHQVLVILYMVARWAEKGCVVLIDEPDLYFHPALISGLLGQLERMVKEKGGQLLVTSHVPDVWRWYERSGMRIDLGPTGHVAARQDGSLVRNQGDGDA